MKPSSAVLVRPRDFGEPIVCCVCAADFHPANYEDRAMRICSTCTKDINDNIEQYRNSDDEDGLNVSYFLMQKSLFLNYFLYVRLPRKRLIRQVHPMKKNRKKMRKICQVCLVKMKKTLNDLLLKMRIIFQESLAPVVTC